MAKNRISDLRDHLFETLEALKDPETPMDIERAKAICEVSQVIINSAKVEVDFAKAIGSTTASNTFLGISTSEEDRRLPVIPKQIGRI